MFVVAIDYAKAFDSILHSHIFDCLRYFGFPEKFIDIIANWLRDRLSCISTDTGYTNFFRICRGVPQGDPLSALIFIIALEILLIKLRSCQSLKLNLTLANDTDTEILEGYADDILAFLPANYISLHELKLILNDYTDISGLALNEKKRKF